MLIFEHFIRFSILGFLVVAASIIRHFVTREPGHGRQAAIVAVVVAAFLAINSMVVTDREQISQVCYELARLVDHGDVPGMGGHLSTDFAAENLEREEFLKHATSTLTSTRVDSVHLSRMAIELGERATGTAVFNVSCTIRTADGFAAPLPTRWRLRFKRVNGRWLVSGIESIPIPPYHFRSIPMQ